MALNVGELFANLSLKTDNFDKNLSTASYTIIVEGDTNGDGAIDQFDYLLVKRHYFETRYLVEIENLAADVNGDGEVNQFDYILIKRHYFGTYTIA